MPPRPRRPPERLSVSRYRESSSADNIGPGDVKTRRPAERTDGSSMAIVVSQASDDSDNSEGPHRPDLQKWFDRSNRRPETGYPQNLEDDESPYFLQRNDSSTSNLASKPAKLYPLRLGNEELNTTTNNSSADDYRSVIDDLTVENKKLRERLRKYEKAQTAHLEKDRLFEVKIHSLPAQKRRELEDVLREFASSIDAQTDEGGSMIPAKGILPYSSLTSGISSMGKHPSSSSTSNSRLVDSAYASMSNSGPTTSSLNNSMEGRLDTHHHDGKDQNTQSFLHNIPDGLLPKHSPVMTEWQKKKMVVQRLEQLFTGYKGVNIGISSQPLQQQEVSKSAANADQKADHDPMAVEGIREAYILPYAMDVDSGKIVKPSEESSNEMHVSGSSDESSPTRSPGQRPTRPLDLDPDRAQIPSENVEYIRHLGLSTPHLASDESAEEADAEGWIYLNLLVNMAQLHIINVTPDFVRAAVSDVSEKFQLSRDGKKIRWRGGIQGTQLSSDCDGSSGHNSSSRSNDKDHGRPKRRKVEEGKLASVHVEEGKSAKGSSGPFQYKPLFYHRRLAEGGILSSDESDSVFGYEAQNTSGPISRPSKLWSDRSRSRSKGRARSDKGPIIFYSGAKFCTDLSGDRGNITTPLHVSGVGKDGYSNYTETALGCESKKTAPSFFRTTSGSNLDYRPLRNYSKLPVFREGEASQSKTQELLEDDQEIAFDFVLENATASTGPPTSLQEFEACGLGNTRPADHFVARVQTRLTRRAEKSTKLTKFSAPGSRFRKFGHIISKSSLDAFQEPESETTEEIIAARLNCLLSLAPSPQRQPTGEDLPIKTEIISARFARLAPSELPPPTGYYTTTSSSEDEYDSDTSFAGVSHLRRDGNFLPRSFISYTDADDIVDKYDDSSDETDGMDEKDEEEDDDESIDMVAQPRQFLPSRAAVVRESEMVLDERGRSASRSALATVSDESGDYFSDA